jgi:5-methylcytosine-specific restriction endonuclease McrA
MAFTEEIIQKVWEKGTIVANNDKDKWRKDHCTAWIARKHYGNRNSTYGWEIDHIKPVSDGGTDELSNLRPLQWQNNVHTSDGRLKCLIESDGINNIEKK